MSVGRFTPDAQFEQEVTSLGVLSRSEVVERWKALFRTPPPKGLNNRLLVRAVAYEMQARRFGAPRAALLRLLAKIAEATPGSVAKVSESQTLKPGARLLRDWNGTTNVIEVTDGGYLWNGETHRSLSAIARAITGARWSGPRFFGLGAK